MARLLKQSTATTLLLGPFLDPADGVTTMTALTIAQADVQLWKEGGTTLAQKNEATSATHRSLGMYTCPVNTTDTNTLGLLSVNVHESGALPIRQDYTVVPANVFDSLVLGSDLLQIDVEQLDGSAPSAALMSVAQLLQQTDTVTNAGFSPTTTEFEVSTIATATADHWIGRRAYFTSGTLQYQGARVTDYALSGGRGHFTVETLTSAPANGVGVIFI
jgi:hypothetical protein